jgi:hypothetical protein
MGVNVSLLRGICHIPAGLGKCDLHVAAEQSVPMLTRNEWDIKIPSKAAKER